MLVIEFWKSASAGDVKHWAQEIRAFRRGMAGAINENWSLQGEYVEMLSGAWAIERSDAVDRLADYSATAAGALERPYLRAIRAKLPDECPYLVEHVVAYDPKRDKGPRADVWHPRSLFGSMPFSIRTTRFSPGRSEAAAGRTRQPD